jgi:hypothetical protein
MLIYCAKTKRPQRVTEKSYDTCENLVTDEDCGDEFKRGSKSEMLMTIQFEPSN